MFVRVEINVYRDRLMLLQCLVFANNGEERFAVHKAHVVHDPPGDSRITVVPMGREEYDLYIPETEVRAASSYNNLHRMYCSRQYTTSALIQMAQTCLHSQTHLMFVAEFSIHTSGEGALAKLTYTGLMMANAMTGHQQTMPPGVSQETCQLAAVL